MVVMGPVGDFWVLFALGSVVGLGVEGLALVGLQSGVRAHSVSELVVEFEVGEPAVAGVSSVVELGLGVQEFALVGLR